MSTPDRGYQRQDILSLFHFIDWMMRLPDELERAWIAQVEQMEAERHMDYVTSVERFAIQKGREEGRETALRLLLRLLTHRFGETPASLRERLQALTLVQIEQFMDMALTSPSLRDFVEQLPIPAAPQ